MNFPSNDPIATRARRRVGSTLCGRYRVARLIGIGGMAAVYAGVHRNGHAVAIKLLHDRLSADPEIERLFRREAHLANTIKHPAVVPVTDDDVTEDGCIFLVMPLLEGETVRARAERLGGRLDVREAVAIAARVLDALTAAHAKKIVHRDIKPDNVFLTRDGEVRVLDFGIGRFFESNDAATATRSGRALGTPAFMAPEQALGRSRDVDGRTDVWSVGAMMFTMLSRQFVHEGENANELLAYAATRKARRLRDLAPDVPEPIAEVVDRALAFEKDARWPDAGAMKDALSDAFAVVFHEPVTDVVIEVPAPAVSELEAAHLDWPEPADDAREAGAPQQTEVLRGMPTRTATGAAFSPNASKPPMRRGAVTGFGIAIGVLGVAAAGAMVARRGSDGGAASNAHEASVPSVDVGAPIVPSEPEDAGAAVSVPDASEVPAVLAPSARPRVERAPPVVRPAPRPSASTAPEPTAPSFKKSW